LQIVKDTLDESSFKAAPTPAQGAVPRPLAAAAATVVERLIAAKNRRNGNKH
jgi:hypothetical protein